MKKNKSALIIFTRFPEFSRVKTRLAKTTSEEFALNVFDLCAQNTFNTADELREQNIDILIFFDGNSETAFREWINKDFYFREQRGESLGDRLADAFNSSFARGYDKPIVIGTDVPDHSVEGLTKAFEALNRSDTVIGPAADGGYYLLGMKSPYLDLFSGIDWGTDKVFSQTMKKIKETGLSHITLQELIDLDTENDIKNWLIQKNGNSKIKNLIKELYNG